MVLFDHFAVHTLNARLTISNTLWKFKKHILVEQ